MVLQGRWCCTAVVSATKGLGVGSPKSDEIEAAQVADNSLGSPPAEQLMQLLRPRYWFSAHLHVKYAALYRHRGPADRHAAETAFLALDKCLPGRGFLQVSAWTCSLTSFPASQHWLCAHLQLRYAARCRRHRRLLGLAHAETAPTLFVPPAGSSLTGVLCTVADLQPPDAETLYPKPCWCLPQTARSLGCCERAQILQLPDAEGPKEFSYDEEWLAVLRSTHSLMSLQRRPVALPGLLFCQQCALYEMPSMNLMW